MNVVDFPITPTDAWRDGVRRHSERRSPTPRHDATFGPLRAEWGPDTDAVRWRDGDDEVPGDLAVARLFGGFDLTGWIDCVGGPTLDAVVAVPADPEGRRTLAGWPTGRWLEAAPGLWMCGAGGHLLVAPVDPVLRASFRERVSRT
jgi:hypothetical protein